MTESQQECQPETNLAKGFNQLGNAFYRLGELTKALTYYQQALNFDPCLAETHNNLGVVLAGLNKVDAALANYDDALRLKPDYVDAHFNLGLLFISRAQWDDAVAELQHTVRLQPDHADAYCNLGYALTEQAKLEEAVPYYQQAMRLKPDYADAHWGVANIRLLQGDFEQAWPEYECWWRLKQRPLSRPHQPRWDGTPLAGRTILLQAEGGLGDTIQFIRYAAVAKQSGGTVIVECQEPLRPLLASCPGIDRLVAAGSESTAFDVHASLLSLPAILRTSLPTVPADIQYLFADAELETKWRRELSCFAGFKIGIAWQGNPRYRRDHLRSISLTHFAPLARVEGVRLLSLQMGQGIEQLDAVANQFQVIDLGSRLDKESGAFMDTAAVMRNLDLVITPDTAVAHLAGALGVPVWAALSSVPDWRWLLDREDSPWYPTMQLFRQTEPGDWDEVFARMAEELARTLSANPQQRSQTNPKRLRGSQSPLHEPNHVSAADVAMNMADDPNERIEITVVPR